MSGPSEPPTPPHRGRLLIVDDFDLELALLRSVFEPAGYEVISANTFADALDLALQFPPDLVITDIRMPGGSGYDLLDAIKSDPRLRSIHVVLLTSLDMPESERQAGLQRGAIRHLARPMRPQALLNEIESCLAEARSRRPAGTILIVDDRPANRQLLLSILARTGHRLLAARDGFEALALARSEHPVLIVADIVMPTMDGYEFVRQLRSDPAISETPVIFNTSSYLESEARQLAEACGVRFIITQPSDPREIVDRVNAVLGGTAPALLPAKAEDFDREHLFVLTNKLSQKVDELEALNAELEGRVQARTAELSAATTRLREMYRRKDEMVSLISHDLRSPLTGVIMLTELLQKERVATDRDERSRLLEIVRSATERMVTLVNDLVSASKAEPPTSAPSQLEPVHVSEVIRSSLEPLLLNANAKQLTLDVDVAPHEPTLHADRLKLSQIFNNLLSNAVKFTPEGGRVAIKVEPAPGGVSASVSDTGVGLDPHALPALFEKPHLPHPIHSAEARPVASEPSPSQGLALVRQLIGMHGGRIDVTSAPNRGSIFTVYLPIAPTSVPA